MGWSRAECRNYLSLKPRNFPTENVALSAIGAREIGVFHWQGKFYAYENLCVHQGGPACEGIMMHKVEDVIGPDRALAGPDVFQR